MLIIPAIDLRDGKYVRLKQGDYALETIYGSDPVKLAQEWQAAGAKLLQVIDLDGAKTGQLVNSKVIEKILATTNIPIQVGGGIQSAAMVKKILALGVNKVIIGTLALEDEEQLRELLISYGEKIIVSLDRKNDQLLKRAWLENSGKNLLETAVKLEKLGVKSFIYTDVLKDGTLSHQNYKSIKSLLSVLTKQLIVAVGEHVSSVIHAFPVSVKIVCILCQAGPRLP